MKTARTFSSLVILMRVKARQCTFSWKHLSPLYFKHNWHYGLFNTLTASTHSHGLYTFSRPLQYNTLIQPLLALSQCLLALSRPLWLPHGLYWLFRGLYCHFMASTVTSWPQLHSQSLYIKFSGLFKHLLVLHSLIVVTLPVTLFKLLVAAYRKPPVICKLFPKQEMILKPVTVLLFKISGVHRVHIG